MNDDDPISVTIDYPDWHADLPNAAGIVRRAAMAALGVAGRTDVDEIGVLLADDAWLRRLNHEYRGIDASTNVLAFAELQGPEIEATVGDIAIAHETAAREARMQRKDLSAHLAHLVVHGVFHLLGYDHQSELAAVSMEQLETAALASIGVADPYGRDGGPVAGHEGSTTH